MSVWHLAQDHRWLLNSKETKKKPGESCDFTAVTELTSRPKKCTQVLGHDSATMSIRTNVTISYLPSAIDVYFAKTLFSGQVQDKSRLASRLATFLVCVHHKLMAPGFVGHFSLSH